MEFRWVVFITLWTFFSGPIFYSPPGASPSAKERQAMTQPRLTAAKSPTAAPYLAPLEK